MSVFIAAIFVSAFLLFQVQPIIARYILPWYGGSPAVWTTCMLFFQTGLLVGYGYAHLIVSVFREKPKIQAAIHLGLVALALLTMPITPDEALKPVGGEATSDVWGIVRLLTMTVGLGYIVVSASGPLIQHWFASSYPDLSPYRLYAVSNLGSLLGLVSYPFLFEPWLGLKHQTWWWSAGFASYGLIALICARQFWRMASTEAERIEGESPRTGEESPGIGSMLLWLSLAACGSGAMLAITNQMCQDVAVVPFLWVLPLGLYLTSFIICFDRSIWYVRKIWISLAAISVGFLVYLLNQQFAQSEIHLYKQIGIYMAALFTLCMVCHGEMVRLKPSSRHLTLFYLMVSLGGALGGGFVSLAAPRIFNGYWELHVILLFASLLVGMILAFQAFRRFRNPIWGGLALLVTVQALVVLGMGLFHHYRETREDSVISLRGFHGVIRAYEAYEGTPDHYRAMFHGRISHGRQYLNPIYRNIPTTYYSENSGVGALLQSLPQRQPGSREPIKMGVVGLGSGSLAVHAEPGDSIVFYEISPEVEQMARSHFTYLEDCKGDASVVQGDARTSLERELREDGPRQFDVLFVDAFSGDSIPIHLMTEESFELYFKHIKEDGALVTHITNLHIDLSDPVRNLAKHFGRDALLVTHYPEDDDYHLYFSEWVIITKNPEIINRLFDGGWVDEWLREEPEDIFWTDDYSNLLEVVM